MAEETPQNEDTKVFNPETDIIDVAVIGAGPAGLTAGLYATRAGRNVVVFEEIAPGGQLAKTEIIENYPGFPEGCGGFELAWNMKEQAEHFGAIVKTDGITAVNFEGDIKRLTGASGVEYKAHNVIIASGARPRNLGIAREEELRGKGVSYCATCDGNFFRNKTVVVVGGGDTAAADAIYLSRICEKVYLVHRRDQLRATQVYHQRLADLSNVEFVWNSVSKEFMVGENGLVSGLVVENKLTGEQRTLEASGVFVAVGMLPNTEFLKGAVACDERGYVIADEHGTTNVEGVFAAGDVRTKTLRQVSTAIADGAQTAELAAER